MKHIKSNSDEIVNESKDSEVFANMDKDTYKKLIGGHSLLLRAINKHHLDKSDIDEFKKSVSYAERMILEATNNINQLKSLRDK